MKVRERCQCGAEFEAEEPGERLVLPDESDDLLHKDLREWRENHSCTALLRAEINGLTDGMPESPLPPGGKDYVGFRGWTYG